MIFQHTWRWIIDQSPHTGKPKISTCRLKTPGEVLWANDTPKFISNVTTEKARYCECQTISVMPARGVKGIHKVADVRLVEIASVDVRTLTSEQIQTEGFADSMMFLALWVSMHDKVRGFFLSDDDHLYHQWRGVGVKWGVYDEQAVRDELAARPAAFYDAWYLRFELATVYSESIAAAENLLIA